MTSLATSLLAKDQWLRDIFEMEEEEEEDFVQFFGIQDDWEMGNCHPHCKSEYHPLGTDGPA